MPLSTQPYKGTRDFYPEDARIQGWMFDRMREVIRRYGYQEYDGPMLENFELYAAKTGEEIVNQQLYAFTDRGDRRVAMRPEMTPTLARMVAARFHELPKPIRWYSTPNLWRYERPQRGRLREHWQLNVDVLGGEPLLADAEILNAALDLMRAFGGEEFVSIRVNNRRLIDHLFSKKLGLGAEVALKVTKLLDARAKMGEEAYQSKLAELDLKPEQISLMERFFKMPFEEVEREVPCQGTDELKSLFALMRESQVIFDPTVLRGMDYYTGTVFEIYDNSPENRRAMFGGGRYDNLLALFGNYPLSGVGFGMGDVTLRNFLEVHQLLPDLGSFVDVFVTLPRQDLRARTEQIARDLRAKGLRVITALETSGFGAQLKIASKHRARFAVLLGDEELAKNSVALKDLSSGEQKTVSIPELAQSIQSFLRQ